jgi:2-dehydropantoate 2-reductase
MSTSKQKIAVVGAGAVGCFFGGMLARSHQELILIGRAERVDAINRFGLQMDCQGFQATVALQACADFTDIADVDVILLSVKSYDTLATMKAMQPFLSANTVIVSLQNGVSNVELIASIVANPVYAAAVYVAVAMTDLNTVKHYGRGELQIGSFATDFARADKHPRALTKLIDQFVNTGVPCALSANIKRELWLKLLVNCSYNAISAIGQISYGQMVQVPHIQVLIQRLTDEFLSIAQCEAVTISKEEATQANALIAQTMAGQKSSTAADLARGKLSEIDFLNGYIVDKGMQYNLATPANQAVYALVKMIEADFK